jgi:hypothetical protein
MLSEPDQDMSQFVVNHRSAWFLLSRRSVSLPPIIAHVAALLLSWQQYFGLSTSFNFESTSPLPQLGGR